MEENARAYDEISKPQLRSGIELVQMINLSEGDKVLDMACGTGNVTKYIADVVGPSGKVVGIDPDASRIKMAIEKYKGISHLEFHIGSNVTGYPHDTEPYYDAHFCNAAFHWLNNDEKKLHVQKAYQCLKPGGKLGIVCLEKMPGEPQDVQNEITGLHSLSRDGYRQLFEAGLFPEVVVEEYALETSFKSFEDLKRWVKTSSHYDLDKVPDKSSLEKYMTRNDDGSISCYVPRIRITASKWTVLTIWSTKYTIEI